MAAEAVDFIVEGQSGSSEPSGLEPGSSRVRTRDDSDSRAKRRVAEYFRALGLADPDRLEELACAVVASCEEESGTVAPDKAVACAQRDFDTFLRGVFRDGHDSIDPLWLRAFFEAHPHAFLGDVEVARAAAQKFGDPWAGLPPTQAKFRDQALRPARVPRWILGLLPPVLLTSSAAGALLLALSAGGLTVPELAWVTLFSFLFGVGAIGFCVSGLGFLLSFRKAAERVPSSENRALPRSALVMPVYHENSEHVFAAVAAMRESLASVENENCFEIFVLSDSRDPERAAEEERAFRRVASSGDSAIPVYYRRRARNDRQKAGNLAEFFERWGNRYTYAVVLDADSLMHGKTLVELVRRMEAAPRLALLQAPLSLHGGLTAFARAQQFASSTAGPLFTRGLQAWAAEQGNYYGHNAILRVRAFLECCALPVLAGEPPLGGHILSHDFVEAALLCRAGWEVRMAADLGGSFEELPPTLPEYVARDRRWCQGNLQHLRIAFAEGLAPMSRLHMLVGAASYLAGPVWVAFVIFGVLLARAGDGPLLNSTVATLLIVATATILLGPRLFGLLAALSNRESRLAHGGSFRLFSSVLLETLFSATLAPLLMLHHTRIVLSILIGRTVRWGPQKRKLSGDVVAVVRAEVPSTLVGTAALASLSCFAPALLVPLSLVWVPLIAAIPLALFASSATAGRILARVGLFKVPTETRPDELALRVHDLRTLTSADESARFRDLLLDPLLLQAQIRRLEQDTAPASRDESSLTRIRQKAVRSGPAALTSAERTALSSDAESLRWLHREAWRHWPVESWHVAREVPQLPPEEVASSA